VGEVAERSEADEGDPIPLDRRKKQKRVTAQLKALQTYTLYLGVTPSFFFGFTSSMRFGRRPLAVTFLSPEERIGPILRMGSPGGGSVNTFPSEDICF
jgi:hypothetical protein